jgi:excisionase family DNA binding protein
MDEFDITESLLTSDEVANFLSVDVVTVRRLVSRGELAAYRVGSEFRFSQQDLEAYLKRQYVPARPGTYSFSSAGFRVSPEAFGNVARALQLGIQVGRDQPKQPRQEERFTPLAAQALAHSDESARQTRRSAIGPVDLLLGLMRVSEGMAGQALRYFGVSERQVQDVVTSGRPADTGQQTSAEPSAPPELSAEVKQALQAAVAEAKRLKHNYLGTEHLLLGLLRDENGPAAALLRELNAPASRVRAHLLDMMKDGGQLAER